MQVRSLLQSLREDGIVILHEKFDYAPFVEYLSKCKFYKNHVKQTQPEGVLGQWPWMCHDMHDVIMAPGLLEMGLKYLPFARDYLNIVWPCIYSVNAFYTEPHTESKPDIQEFHRDGDDTDFLALFFYCTDVFTDEDGPHEFKVGTHLGANEGHAVKIYGGAGTMFLAATKGFHRGLLPKRGRRMIAWARYGVSAKPASYVWDGLQPTPKEMLGSRYPYGVSATNHEHQAALRLIVA